MSLEKFSRYFSVTFVHFKIFKNFPGNTTDFLGFKVFFFEKHTHFFNTFENFPENLKAGLRNQKVFLEFLYTYKFFPGFKFS